MDTRTPLPAHGSRVEQARAGRARWLAACLPVVGLALGFTAALGALAAVKPDLQLSRSPVVASAPALPPPSAIQVAPKADREVFPEAPVRRSADQSPEPPADAVTVAVRTPLEIPPLPMVAPERSASLPLPPLAPATGPGAVIPLPPVREVPRALVDVPMPTPRPPELAARGDARDARRARTAAAPAAPAPEPNLLQRLFGAPAQPSGPALAYAVPGDAAPRPLSPGPVAPAPSAPGSAVPGPYTAVYDISAQVLILPNGEKLEAHSGLGDHRDDPRKVHVRMRGATPPHTYDLTMREALFHGVRAIRMNPVGGSRAIHGRAGLLVHHYLLGPNGDSNGCVSVRDYDKFLQAYLRGEVRRLVVVPGSGGPVRDNTLTAYLESR